MSASFFRRPARQVAAAAAASADARAPGDALGSQLVEALGQARPGERVAWLLARLGGATPENLERVAAHFRMEALTMAQLRAFEPDFSIASFTEFERRGCLAGRLQAGAALCLVVTDPTDLATWRWLERRARHAGACDDDFALADAQELAVCMATLERSLRAMDAVETWGVDAAAGAADALSISLSNIDATASSLVRLIDSTLLDALRSSASDVHFETSARGLSIKYRIDGVLVVVRSVDSLEVAHQAISRIKVLSELDIAERRVPQDGRFKVSADGRDIDFRVSIMPNLFGEDAVLRVLDRTQLTGQFRALTLETLRFSGSTLAFVRTQAAMPHGLLLVTGPTGSGKTTTLYAAISEINTGLDKIVTIEDPIEYQLEGVLQIPVNEKKGVTFARGLRSILRHDPDKIMVGEIRDPETAHIAVQAALTGHQVFTTVHANNVFDVIGRFANMGIDTYSLVAALNGVVAQRLIRLNCPQCAVAARPGDEAIARARLSPAQVEGARFEGGLGCPHCRGSGFKGRRAIAEWLPIDAAMRDLIVQRTSLSQMREAARSNGFASLRDAALALALAGETTLDEVNRVTSVE